MFRDAFTRMDQLETADLLGPVNEALQGQGQSPFDPARTTVLAMGLSFYPGYRLLEIADHSLSPVRELFCIIAPDHRVSLLDWTNVPIYALNASVPVQLNEQNITEYTRFFFAYVRGRHGRFLLAETIDDIVWRDEPPAPVRKTLGGLIEPLAPIGTADDGSFILNARMVFKNSLFKARVFISPDGFVALRDEELVIEDLPVQDDVLAG